MTEQTGLPVRRRILCAMDSLLKLRPVRWLRALLGGYFWKRCERCGHGFAGFEWDGALVHAMCTGFLGGGMCAYCPQCAATRAEWEPGWYDRYCRLVAPDMYAPSPLPDPRLTTI